MPSEKEQIDFKKILIFKSGTFNNIKTTPEHLADIVRFFEDHQNIYADLKLDHIEDKKERDDLYPLFKNFPYSLGKIKDLETAKNNTELYGDYINVLKPIKNAIDDKLLTTHSAEIYYNVTSKTTGKKYKAVLAAVALLPAGKLPALMEVFKPYMYELQQTEAADNPFMSGFEWESKEVCQLIIEEYQESQEIFSFMTKENYEKQMKLYAECGMKTKKYEEYEKMTDTEKMAYENMMKEKYQEYMKSKKKFELEDITMSNQAQAESKKDDSTPSKQNYSIADLADQIESLRKEKQAYAAAINELKTSAQKEAEFYKAEFEKLNTEKKRERVNNFVSGLIKSENPKLLPAQKDLAVYALMSANENVKVNYSFGDSEVSKSNYDLIVDLLSALPEIQQVYSQKSVVENNNGEKAGFESFSLFYKNIDAEAAELTHKKVVKYAQEHNLNIAPGCPEQMDNYAMAKDAVEIFA